MAAGVTNAAPIGGGLKVIASGTIPSSSMSATLPSPALMLIFQIDYSGTTLGGTVLQGDITQVYAGNSEIVRVELGTQGSITVLRNSSAAANLRYIALG